MAGGNREAQGQKPAVRQSVSIASAFTGPLPPPEAFAAFERTL
jgi:hypothetical protein